jgi:1,4-dihydroxy-2-naphthoate octaprenyltransferase
MKNAVSVLKTIRFPFLILTPVSVFLGLSTALQSGSSVNPVYFILVLLGAVAAHISVNTFNEYYDFKSGLDSITARTPFSGGSGALPVAPNAAGAVFFLAVATMATTILVGLYFVYLRGPSVLPIGLAGVVIVVTYTQWINRHPFLCLIAPGLGIGTLMVVGTHLILTGGYSSTALIVSLVPFFLVNNILLLNQYPDINADKHVGRKNIPIAFGTATSNLVYGLFILAAYATVALGVVFESLPRLSLIGLIPAALALTALVGALRHATNVEKLIPYLAMNVAAAVLTPVLLGVSLIIG